MANKNLFNTKTASIRAVPDEDIVTNEAGGVAYKMDAKHLLCQLVFTGTFNGTFYNTAEQQLNTFKNALADVNDASFLANLAVMARNTGFMKDTPAYILAELHKRGETAILKEIFNIVVDRTKILMTFMQIVRSGVTGRKSFGHATKKIIQKWFNSKTDEQLFKGSIGNNPSMGDIIKMIHPKPKTKEREALFAYFIGSDKVKSENLPQIVKDYEAFKKDKVGNPPNVPFQMLTSLDLEDKHWKTIASNAPWQMTRMNINTFFRHNVLKDKELVKTISERLENADMIKRSKVFPYQLYAAFINIEYDVPKSISNALQKAAEIACGNIPDIPGDNAIALCVDTSGSMSSPVTGMRKGSTSKIRRIDCAAIFASALMRKHPDRVVLLPFDTKVHTSNLNPMDSIMTNAQKMAKYGGGGTDCASAMAHIIDKKLKCDAIVYISDNESWANSDKRHVNIFPSSQFTAYTSTFALWEKYRKTNKTCKLINIDIDPNTSTQVPNIGKDILNVGGFSDQIFNVIANFIDKPEVNTWVKMVEDFKFSTVSHNKNEDVEEKDSE